MGTPFKQHTGLLSPWVDGMRVRRVSRHIKPKANVLDVGCGPGLLIPCLPAGCSYTGLDSDPSLVDSNQKRFSSGRFYCLDVCGDKWPVEDQTCDIVVMAAFIEHVDVPAHLFAEVERVISHSGRVVMTTPSKWGGFVHEGLAHMGLLSSHAAEEHKGFLNLSRLKEMLASTRLTVEFFEFFQCGLNQLFILKWG